jgi:hypothetical protein
MLSLLLLSMALSAPATAARKAVVPGNSLVVEPPPLVLMHAGLPQQLIEELQWARSHPQSVEVKGQFDERICYKIRAYVFSNEPAPKLMRETTCGPLPVTTRQIDGATPKLVPLDHK